MLSLLAFPGVAEARKRPAPAPVAAAPVRVAPSDPIEAFYFRHNDAPLWLRNASTRVGAERLSAVLKRSPIDGFNQGPQLAAQIDAALAQAAANPAAAKAAEIAISRAFVSYAQYLKTPPQGMIFGYDVLKPQNTARPDVILLTAAAAPNLAQHVDRVADINPHYRQIRDAAIASGMVSADTKLLANLERARVLPAGGRYVLVDAATARLTMYDNGVPVDSMKVIVGTDELPTPMIASIMYYITYNPYWNAPDHLVRNAIAPKTIAGGMKYFKGMGYNVMADWTANSAILPAENVDWKAVKAGSTHLRIRQDPGPKNFMGVLKYPFANSADIYLHDTPAKDLFKQSNRALSNGCIRLERASDFGRWLLGGRDPGPPGTEPEIQAQLPKPTPIYITYLTAQVEGGRLAYVKDAYGWDGRPDRQVAASGQIQAGGLR